MSPAGGHDLASCAPYEGNLEGSCCHCYYRTWEPNVSSARAIIEG
jgi:hypothetical protein